MRVIPRAGWIPAPGTKIMDDITEENQKRDEKKAFYVGLATVISLILIVFLVIFFIRGCSSSKEDIKSANNQTQTSISTQPAPAQPANVTAGNVAGSETQTSPSPQVQGQKYTVQNGDTLYEIGKKFKVDWHSIAEANNIDNAGALKVGSQIIIPSE